MPASFHVHSTKIPPQKTAANLVSQLVLQIVGVSLRLRENQHEALIGQVVKGADQHGQLLVLLDVLHLQKIDQNGFDGRQKDQGKNRGDIFSFGARGEGNFPHANTTGE